MSGKVVAGESLSAVLAHHDSEIKNLGGRMHGVETGLRTLQGEVHSGFAGVQQAMGGLGGSLATLNSKLDSAPKFDAHKYITTIVSLAVLFGMICTGIIYISGSQFSAVIAEQKAFNASIAKTVEKHEARIEKHDAAIDRVAEAIGRWATTASAQTPRR